MALLENLVHLKKHPEFSNFRWQQLSRTRDQWPPAAAAARGLFLTFYTCIGATNPVTSIRLACLWLNEAPVQPTSSGPHVWPAPTRARVVLVHAREANVPGDDTIKPGTESTYRSISPPRNIVPRQKRYSIGGFRRFLWKQCLGYASSWTTRRAEWSVCS